MGQLPSQHVAARREPFGYVCHACSRCCHHKHIQTNPYEVARLAEYLGVSTSDFRARWTAQGAGTALSQTTEGACVFLAENGCSVHPARPLVCRLYPLGRRRSGEGDEAWERVKAHPHSLGEYTREGAIADFLEKQGAQPFIDAADAYVDWVNAARSVLTGAMVPDSAAAAEADLLDMDAALERYCADNGIVPPADVEARKDLHLKLLYEQLETLEGAQDGAQ